MDTINIPGVPSSVLVPGQYIAEDTSNAINALPPNTQSVLLCGHGNADFIASGGVGAGIVKRILTTDDAINFWGQGSVLHMMAKAALATGSPCALYGVCDEGATGSGDAPNVTTVAFAITAPEATTLNGAPGTSRLWIGGTTYEFQYDGTSALSDICGAFATAINADGDCPFTADGSSGTSIVLTAKGIGDAYDDIEIGESHDSPGAQNSTDTNNGWTSTITAVPSAVEMDYVSIIAAIAGAKFNKYVFPTVYSVLDGSSANVSGEEIVGAVLPGEPNLGESLDSLEFTALTTFIDTISGPTEQRPGVLIKSISPVNSFGDMVYSETASPGVNDGRVIVPFYPGSRMGAFQIGAAFAAVLANRENPNQHFDGEPIPGLDVVDTSLRLINSECNILLGLGICPIVVNGAGVPTIMRAVTTYTTNPITGMPDQSLLDVTTITALDYLRLAIKTMQQRKYRQANITDNLLKAIPCDIAAELNDMAALNPPIVENVAAAAKLIRAERSSVVGRVNVSIPAFIVQGLHVLAEVITLQIDLG